MSPQAEVLLEGRAMATINDAQRRIALLRGWLAGRLAADQLMWVDEQTARIAAAPAGNILTIAVGLAGLVLGGAILLYNWHHKGNPVAPFVRGLCRALVYVAAASSVTANLPQAVLVPAAATLAYVAGLTYAARTESLDRIGSLWPLLLLAAPVAVGLAGTDFSVPAIIALAAMAVCAARVAQLLRRRAGGDVSRAVGLLIAAIALNDALFASTTGATYAAVACLACFTLTLILQRYVPAS
jgi:4-hydroxybenzoate polyprenyltransferase